MKRLLFLFVLGVSLWGCNKDEDEQAPKLLSSNPAMDAKEVPLTTQITLNFDEPVALSTTSKILVNDVEVEAIAEGTSVKLVFALKSNTSYKILIPEMTISDLSGNYVSKRAILFTSEFKVIINTTLATPNPIPQAVNVYNYLKDSYGVKSISGIMDLSQCQWVKSHTDKLPALCGFDFIFLHTTWRDYTNITDQENWWNNGGLVTFSWHWNVPLVEGSSEYSYRYVGQQPGKLETTFDITKATIEGTWEYKTVTANLDKVAPIFIKMQDKGIPVLWRPLHEASGAWFWWGAKGPEPCIKLWRFMFDYLKNKGVRNLIWIWTADANPDKGTNDISWYPGDEYVDIIGTDIYDKTTAAYFTKRFDMLQRLFPTKMIAMSEYGKIGKYSDVWSANAKWSFFMSWADGSATTTSRAHAWANADWWDNAFAQDYVLTIDEMPSLK